MDSSILYRDCSEIIEDTMLGNQIDPSTASSSVTLVGCAFTDSEVEKLLRDAASGEAGVAGVDVVQDFLQKYPGKVDAVREFLKKYPDRLDARVFRERHSCRKTFLQVAAQKGYRELCILLLDAGASLHAVNKKGPTPLHYAAVGNQPDILDLLLSRGADVNAVNNGLGYQNSALHLAVNHVQCVRVLLRYHCDVNLQNSNGNTALHEAIGKDALDVIDALCACERIDFTLRNKRGFNILHYAAIKGNVHATEKLLSRARQLVDVKTVKRQGRFTALHLAALNGRRKVAAILLSQVGGRAKVDLRNNRQQTPLHLATSRGHWSLVELLVHHNADVGSKDTDGNTVLHIAIVESQNQQTAVPTPESSRHSPLIYAIWQNLAKQGAKTELALACFLVSMDRSCKLLEQVRNNKDKTPLDLLEGNPQVARLTELLRSYKYRSHSTQLKTINNRSTGYIEPPTYRELKELFRDADGMKAGVDAVQDFLKKYPDMVYPVREFLKKFPNMVDACAFGGDWKSTCTFVHVAAHRGYHELCTYLLDAGASLCAVDEDGDTLLHYAAFGNQPEILDLLLSRGADVNAVNNRRCSALHVAVNKQHVQCVRVLLRYHCDVNLQDSYGNTALHHAARKGTLDVIHALCACERIDFTLRDKWGSTILHRVALSGNAHATERLIARARQLVDVKEVDGFAALHLAALNGHREVAVILLSQNGGRAKVDLRNNRRQTPLHLATSRGHWSLVELLVHHNADVGSTDKDGDTVLHIAIAKTWNQHTAGSTPESSRDSPLVYTIWQNLARQGAKTELALGCFLVSVDRSCKLLEQVRNNKNKTPLDLLEGNPQAARLAELLRSYIYQSHSTQLKMENNPPTGYVEPPTYRIDNISQSELRGTKENIAGFGDPAECRDCSGIIADTKQENLFDPIRSVTLVGCARCGHTVVKTQSLQDDQLTTGEVSIARPEDVSSEGKRKEEIGEREKEKDKEGL